MYLCSVTLQLSGIVKFDIIVIFPTGSIIEDWERNHFNKCPMKNIIVKPPDMKEEVPHWERGGININHLQGTSQTRYLTYVFIM